MKSFSQTHTTGQLKWIAIARELASGDPIRCPFCELAYVHVFDSARTETTIDSWVTCPACHEATTIRTAT